MNDGLFINDRLRISLTNNCNFKCKYCSNEGQIHNTGNFISCDFLDRLFNKVKEEKIYIKKINLTGGEPLLHKNIIEIAFMASKVCKNVTVNTNGSLLTKQLVDDLIQVGVNCIKFGIDNPFSSFSKPVINNAKVDIDKLIEIIMYSIKKIPRSSLNIVITRYNINMLPKMISWIIDNNINNVEFIELIDFNFCEHTPLLGDEPYNFVDLIRNVSNLFCNIEYNEKLAKYIAYHRNGTIVQFAEDFCKKRVCANLWTRIDSNGFFSPCIKSTDIYPIDLNMSLTNQLKKQKKLYCDGLSDYIPRNTNGFLTSCLQRNIVEKNTLTDKLTDLDI